MTTTRWMTAMYLPTKEELDARLHERCHGNSSKNVHPEEWTVKELFGSKLIKLRATDYALHVGRRVPSEDFDGRWGFVGRICDIAFADWPHSELRTTRSIGYEDWRVSMSCDAVGLTRLPSGGVGVRVGEGKNFEFNTGVKADEKVRNAIDQALLWQALAWNQVQEGDRHFPLSPFVDLEDALTKPPFDWPVDAVPDGIVVACFPNHCSPTLRKETLDFEVEQLDRHREFFLNKARHILTTSEAIANGMDEVQALSLPGGALEWERTHGKLEFLPITERSEPRSLPDVEALMQQYSVAKAAMKEAEAKETALRAALEAAVAQVAYADGSEADKWKHRLDGIGSVSWQPGGNVVERQASSYVSKPGIRFTPARNTEVEA